MDQVNGVVAHEPQLIGQKPAPKKTERKGYVRLDDSVRRRMIREAMAGDEKQKDVAARYGVSATMVGNAVKDERERRRARMETARAAKTGAVKNSQAAKTRAETPTGLLATVLKRFDERITALEQRATGGDLGAELRSFLCDRK